MGWAIVWKNRINESQNYLYKILSNIEEYIKLEIVPINFNLSLEMLYIFALDYTLP